MNSVAHASGATETIAPSAPSISADTLAAVQATRRARATSPAPIAMPTIGTDATPMPKAIGMSRNSRRWPMP